MTQSMHTIGYVELKESDKADKFLNQSMQNMWEPFNVWTESHSQDQKKSMVDMGCYNFLTGAAGFIQSIIYGYGGLRYREDGLHITPMMPEGTNFINFRGLKYKGATFDVKNYSDFWYICLTEESEK